MAFTKQIAVKEILKTIDKKNAERIQMTGSGYESPDKLSFNSGYGNNRSYTPDAVVTYEDRTDIYSIETTLNKKDLPDIMHKWILFSSAARKKGGDLYLVLDEKKYDDCTSLLESKQIVARVIKVSGKK